MMQTMHGRRRAVLGLGVGLLTGLAMIGPAQSAAAQPPAGVVPTGGAWCGQDQDGASVVLDVSSDGKYVLAVYVMTPRGSVGSRTADVQGVTKSQVVDSRFIFRQRRDQTVCERDRGDDPRNPRERCETFTVEDTTIRGVFADPNHVSGSYSSQNVYDPGGAGDDPPRGPRGRPSRRMIAGSYTAWPVGFAPCP